MTYEPEGTAAKGSAPPVAPHLTRRARKVLLHAQLVSERTPMLGLYKQLNKYLFTARGRFLTSDGRKADRRSKDSLDGTAIMAARTCAAGIATGVTNPAREWFRLTTPDPDLAEYRSVKEWLHTVTQRMRAVLLGSNFYKAMYVMYGDMAGYGTSPVIIEEDDRTIIRCYPFPIGSYCLANDAHLRVDTLSREFQMSVRQLVEFYGWENCSTTVQGQWRAGQTEAWHDVVHVIQPNPDADATKLASKFKPFLSCTFEKGANEEDKFRAVRT